MRPAISAVAWYTSSGGVPSPSGAIAVTERIRPGVASSRQTRAPREYPATWKSPMPSWSISRSTASASVTALGRVSAGSLAEPPKPELQSMKPSADTSMIRFWPAPSAR